MKTLIITYKPSYEHYLVDMFDDSFLNLEGYYEGKKYIIASTVLSCFEEKVTLDEVDDYSKNLEEIIHELSHTNCSVTTNEMYNASSRHLITYLMNRSDVNEVIWFFPDEFSFLYDIYLFRKKRDWIPRPEYLVLFDYYNDGLNQFSWPPKDDYIDISGLNRVLECAHASYIASKMIELYFSKAIYYINDKTLNHYFEDRPIGELDVIFLKHIYDAKDKHYNWGSVILENEDKDFISKRPRFYKRFPSLYNCNENALETLSRQGLLSISKSVKLLQTEKGRILYEIIKLCLPCFWDEEKFIHRRKVSRRIITGEITESEYLLDIRKYIVDCLNNIKYVDDAEAIWRELQQRITSSSSS